MREIINSEKRLEYMRGFPEGISPREDARSSRCREFVKENEINERVQSEVRPRT
jgi:hypothetical protein